MQRALMLLVATAVGPGCAGVRIVNAPEVAPRYQLETGSRVRVHLVQPRGTVVGNVVRVTADSLVLTPEATPLRETALSAANIGRLELSLGQRSRKGRGALVGLVVGTVGGYLALLSFCSESCVGAWPLLGLIPGGALVGAGIGAGVGSLIRTERWQAVSWR